MPIPVRTCDTCYASFDEYEWGELELTELELVSEDERAKLDEAFGDALGDDGREFRRCSCGNLLQLNMDAIAELDMTMPVEVYAVAYPKSERPAIFAKRVLEAHACVQRARRRKVATAVLVMLAIGAALVAGYFSLS